METDLVALLGVAMVVVHSRGCGCGSGGGGGSDRCGKGGEGGGPPITNTHISSATPLCHVDQCALTLD